MTPQPLAPLTSLKVKLGVLVGVSVVVAALIGTAGRLAGVPALLSLPLTIALALALTQLLASGMTAPLRQMTAAARRMATGDYAVRVTDASRDEVGELARAFNTMARDLATVDTQRRELVANVSHELRTPLAGLVAILDNLADGIAPDRPDALATAHRQAERLAGLVDDLLDLARVDAGRAPLAPQPVPLAGLLDEAVAEAAVLPRGVEYAVHVSPPHLVVSADAARLRQLVANLLDNASRHSPPGGTVAVAAERDGDRYRIEVRDHGPGVADEDRERAFEPFGTLSDGVDGGAGGTGLGLAIARWVADLHGGTIRFADPVDGGGARVVAELPLAPPDRTAPEGILPTTDGPPAPPSPAPVAAPGVLDDLFGAFWRDRGVAPRLGLLLGAAGVGTVAALVLPNRSFGLGLTLVLLAAGAVVFAATPHRREPYTLACAGLSALLALVSTIRDAEWVAVLCALAGAATCLAGVTRARSATGLILSAIAWPLAGLRGLPWLGRTLGRLTGLGHGAALLRTFVWSALGLLVFGALFVSADALVAEWVDALLPDLTFGTLVLRVFLGLAIGGVVLAAAYLAVNPPRVERPTPDAPVARRFEWLAPMLVVIGVFVAFLVARATVAFGGHDYLRRTTGLTYADYVHQGFGQLTVASALTLLVLWAVLRKAPRETASDRAWLRGTTIAQCALTLVVVASSLHRMHLYQEAYGFTELRLLVDVFTGWIGIVVLTVAAGGATLTVGWLPRFVLLSGAATMLALALVNPDAWVARHNLDRYAESGRVDWAYLNRLSDDAVPVLAGLDGEDRRCALLGRTAAPDDWLEWNLGRDRAADLLPEATIAIVPDACPEKR